MQDIELIDREALDALWSPLESSKTRKGREPASSLSPPVAGKTIVINIVTGDDELDNSLASRRKKNSTREQDFRIRTMSSRRHVSLNRWLQNFARGMASAFGTSVTSRPQTVGRKIYLNDFDLGDWNASTSFRPGLLPSGTRIRLFFSRLGGKVAPLSPEQRPLAAEYHVALTS